MNIEDKRDREESGTRCICSTFMSGRNDSMQAKQKIAGWSKMQNTRNTKREQRKCDFRFLLGFQTRVDNPRQHAPAEIEAALTLQTVGS